MSTQGKKLFPTLAAWILTVILSAGLLSFLVWQPKIARAVSENRASSPVVITTLPETPAPDVAAAMPAFTPGGVPKVLTRAVATHTELNKNLRTGPYTYIVQSGDSVWKIANDNGVSIESIYFANYDVLYDQADNLMPGMELTIPPVTGIYHKWRSSDTFATVASKYGATVQDILLFIGNNIDLANPSVQPGTQVMVPNGARELIVFSPSVVGVDASGNTISSFSGPGACATNIGLFGNGFFVWPSAVHYLTGNDFGPGHNGIDLGAGAGSALFAADSGTVVYAGWMNGGYGNLVVIDHGNGYQTWYEHLESLGVSCGQNIFQGSVIGAAGTTGNSTGAHLHFEIRYGGTPVNPWDYLP